MNETRNAARKLTDRIGNAWNQFWFRPADALPLCVLRILVGLVALYFVFSHTADIVRWFGPNGILSIDRTKQIVGMAGAAGQQTASVHRLSYFYWFDAPAALYAAHVCGLVVVLALTLGLFTRIATVLSLLVVLSYVHRAPMLTGELEPVLTMLLFYLMLSPCGKRLSLDGLLARRKTAKSPASVQTTNDPKDSASSWAAITRRLIQVHIAAFYLVMGLSKLRFDGWWDGEAVWGLIAYSESRLIDLTFLHNATYVLNFWTHAIVVFELSFAVLIWNRTARPILLVISIFMWSSLALLTGQLAFCALMLVANLAFVPAATLRELLAAFRRLRHSRVSGVAESTVGSC